MSKRKQKRLIYRIKWNRNQRRWRFTVDGMEGHKLFHRKTDAIRHGRKAAKATWQVGTPSQLMVHDKRGRFHIEASYGCDSKRRKG